MTDFARAAIFHAAGKPLELRAVACRPPAGGEVLVRVACCTLCGSALHTYTGRRQEATPAILGHEIVGRIAQLGPAAPRTDLLGQPLAEGDRITWTIAASCGQCRNCTRDLPQKCERLFKYGHEPLTERHPLSGGLAEYCLLAPGSGIVRLPDALPDTLAATANCAAATVMAALRRAEAIEGRVVLVQGAGMLGLLACAAASARGAEAVIACDVQPARLQQAARFGATHTADPGALHETVMKASDGRGADVALELSGSAKAIDAALPLLALGARYVLVGAVAPTAAVAIDPQTMVRRCLSILGQHNYAPRDLVAAVEFLRAAQARYPLAELVGDAFPLTEVEAAFALAAEQRGPRVAVLP